MFAVGAIAAAFALGVILYAVYPDGFSAYSDNLDGTVATSQLYSDGTLPNTATPIEGSNSTANQNSTDASPDATAPASSGGGY